MYVTRPPATPPRRVTDLWDDTSDARATRHLASSLPAPVEAAPLRERFIPSMLIEQPRRRRRATAPVPRGAFRLLYIEVGPGAFGILRAIAKVLGRIM